MYGLRAMGELWVVEWEPSRWAPKNMGCYRLWVSTATGYDRVYCITNYEPEIEALYLSVEETTQSDIEPPTLWNTEETCQFIKQIVSKVMNTETLGDNEDFFQRGCDSLQATWIRNALLRAVRDSAKARTNAAPENLVYQYPTIAKLTNFTVRLASRGVNSSSFDNDRLQTQNMEDMVARYSTGLPTHSILKGGTQTAPREEVYLVTGTTGSLGASLLGDILDSPSTAKVFAVNRPGRGASTLIDRQATALRNIGLDPESLLKSPRLVLVEAEITDTNAGFTSLLAEEIRASVTHIILNAWPVDFNLSLQSFEPSVKAVRNLIDIALSSSRSTPPKVTFVSSIGVLARHHGRSSASEASAPPSLAEGTGYSQSKWVAESILLKAAESTSLPIAIIRVGQISGGLNGYWKKSDWLPTIVKSSRALGYFPSFEDDKVVSWVPLHAASQVLLEVTTSSPKSGQVFHLVHPNPVSAVVVSQMLASKLGVPLIPYPEWLEHLESRAKIAVGEKDLHAIPALRMVPFFRFVKAGASAENKEAWGLPSLDTSQTRMTSAAANSMTRIDKDDIEKWVKNWFDTDFL